MAITLNILENEPINLSVAEPEAMDLSVGETTVITENDYTNLINIPSIEGTELNGDVSLNALNGYTQEQIDTKLSVKADRSEIPSLDGYATEAWVESQNYASEDDIYTKGQTDNLLADKADKSEIPSLNGYATQQWVTDKHYLTEHQSLAGYATEQWIENKHYLTEHQSLDGYATEQYVDDAIGSIESGVTSVNGQTGAVTLNIPSKTSDLTNDSGFLTSYTETDPTVPAWAKAASKPTYTASEVGALSGNAGGLFYGTCPTAAKTTAKEVECDAFTADDLKAGTIIVVTFSATNSGAVASLTMNVNDTGAKPIKYINNGTLGNLTSAGCLKANTEYPFYYDGANWVALFNYNTTYSTMSEAEMETGTATSNRVITAARLKQAVLYHAPKELPTVATTDEGKFLRVSSSGTWVAEAVPSAESEAY